MQLDVDHFLVSNGIDAAVDVHNVVVIEAPQHVKNGISGSDVAQKLVAEPLSFARTFHKTCDVDDFHRGRDDILGLHKLGKFVQSRIRNRDDPQIGFNGAERKIRALGFRIGKTVEKGGFPDVGQTNDATLQGHVVMFL